MRTTLLLFALTLTGMSGTIQAAKPKPRPATTHKVKKGETATRIARANGLTMDELTALNPRLKLGSLPAGAVVKVRGVSKTPVHAVAALRLRNVALAPVAPLPGTPALGPASLVHLERVLPVDVRLDLPAASEQSDRSALSAAAAPALASMRSVLPESADDELLVPTLENPRGFEPADPAHLNMLWPVETRTVSSAWGPRMRSKTVKVKARKRKVRYRGSHRGVDLTAPKGTDVFAALDGQVVASGRHRQYGNFVALDHGNGVVTLYAHHHRNFVKDGDVVLRGQKIAEVGRTGNATGVHLHFELRLKGLPVNPLPMLNDAEEIPAELLAQNQLAGATASSR